MISTFRFAQLLHNLFLKPMHLMSTGFSSPGSTAVEDYGLIHIPFNNLNVGKNNGRCIWWHEEPLNYTDLTNLQWFSMFFTTDVACHDIITNPDVPSLTANNIYDVNFHLFANSEKSPLKKSWLRKYPVYDWYFFYHGFVALNWFSDFKYLDYSSIQPSRVFICLNHILNNNRSYRISLLSNLRSNDLEKFGLISAPLLTANTIKTELFNKYSRLTSNEKYHIFKHLLPTAKEIFLDADVDYNYASADINIEYSTSALWHIVTETNFYDDKLHLTEKIFKPIAIRRPFILVGGPKNLKYLRSYGFKTFSQWIDESYDNEYDPEKRMTMIINEIKKLCNLSPDKQLKMYHEMNEILEYNHQHLFGKFKEIIVEELIDNFKKCVFLYNKDLSSRYRLPEENLNYNEIRKILLK